MKRWAITRRDRWYPHRYPVGAQFFYMAVDTGGEYVWVRLFMHQGHLTRERKRFERHGLNVAQTGRVRFKTRYLPQPGIVRPI